MVEKVEQIKFYISNLTELVRSPKTKPIILYLIVGGINTFIGFLLGYFILSTFRGYVPTPLIGIFGGSLAILISFLNFKLFVFRGLRNVVKELVKFYLVQMVSVIVGTIALVGTVDMLELDSFLCQLISMVTSTIFAAVCNFKFTFNDDQ